jgi:hypothetical protein
MAKYIRPILASASKAKPSAFIKQPYRRGIALIGTSSLVLGFGVSTSSPAYATPFSCVNDGSENDNTAQPVVGDSTASRDAILDVLEDHSEICLDGNFIISSSIEFDRDIHVYGVGDSKIESEVGGVFGSDIIDGVGYVTVIENLDIENTTGAVAISGYDVVIADSTFSNNNSGAVDSLNQLLVINSVFVNNIGGGAISNNFGGVDLDPSNFAYITGSTFSGNSAVGTDDAIGGAVKSYGVVITNSTFSGNSAVGPDALGGAVAAYAVSVSNSTFLDNEVQGTGAKGGAIGAIFGDAYFNTFVDNEAPLPLDSGDVPGNAIYSAAGFIDLAANIFAGESEYPQLGLGDAFDDNLFIDGGGNVFSNIVEIETDIEPDVSSKFGFDLISIFGTNLPTLATFSPNSNGTQTIEISPSGPAVDVVPSQTFIDIQEHFEGFNSSETFGVEGYPFNVNFDQRGGARSNPADAGAFEITTASLAKTGNQNSWWFIVASATLLAFGSFATAVTSRLRRRSN